MKPNQIEKYGNKIDEVNYFILWIGVLVLPARYLNDSIFAFLVTLFAEVNFLTQRFEQDKDAVNKNFSKIGDWYIIGVVFSCVFILV